MPIYPDPRKRKGCYQFRHYVAGKPKTLIWRGKRRDAERAFAAWVAELETEATPRPRERSPKFADYSVEYLETRRHRFTTARSWRTRRSLVVELVRAFGELRVNEITDARLERWLSECASRGIRATTTNHRARILRTILRCAEVDGYQVTLPRTARLKEQRLEGRVRPWSAEDVAALVRCASERDPWLVAPLLVMLHTGMRPGEVIAMRWNWIDETNRMIRIPANAEWRPKDGESRDVPIARAIAPYLRPHATSEYLFPVPAGRFVGRPYVTWPWQRLAPVLKLAGVHGHAYTARHTFASHFCENWPGPGDALKALAEIMGHSHKNMTERYAHFLPGHLERTRDVVTFDVTGVTAAETRAALRWR